MESITKFFKIENDPFYQLGEAKARNEVAIEMKKERWPVDQIVKYTKLSIEEIEKL